MKPSEQKRLLMDVTPGAPMHEMMKRFWLPMCLSSDVAEPGGDPHQVTALGRDFVVFRDHEGRVGLLNEHCSHRNVSLCLGRNEKAGLRCIFHGWTFDVDGKATDLPNVSDPRLKERVHQPAYAVRDAGGIIWGYLGPKELEPPFPHLPFFDVAEENRHVELMVSSSNYTRVIEALLDSSHTGVLHQDALKASGPDGDGPKLALGNSTRVSLARSISMNLAPDIEVQETDFGLRYAAIREVSGEGDVKQRVARVTAWRFPTMVYTPGDNLMQLALPVGNDRSHFFMVFWDSTQVINQGTVRDTIREYYGIDDNGMDRWGLGREFHDLPGRPNRSNRWGQDREAMRQGSFTGMQRFIPEDFSVSASMGPIDLDLIEHLVPADLAIARFRRRLVDNAQRVQRGDEVLGTDPRDPFRAAVVTVREGENWQDSFRAAETASGS